MENTFGLQLRNDWINNGLYRTEDRVRVDKTDYYATGASLPLPRPYFDQLPNLPRPGADRFTDTITSFLCRNKIQWAQKVPLGRGPARRTGIL